MAKGTPTQRRENLDRLTGSLTSHCTESATQTAEARRWASRLPLCHSLSFGALAGTLQDGELRSQLALGHEPGEAETLLETADDVFFYVGAFNYPGTECGFLFLPSLEADHLEDGVATPFDSGALAYKLAPPGGYLDGFACVRAHELPLDGHRGLLGSVICDYHPYPGGYLRNPVSHQCNCGVLLPHPFGLTGGDERASTFEVRIPGRAALSPPHLLAVFVREGLEIAELSDLYALGVRIEKFRPEENEDFFHALRESCVSFIENHLVA